MRRLPAESEPPTSYSRPRAIAPPSTSDAFAVVPPMSKAIAIGDPEPPRDAERRDDPGRGAGLQREDRPSASIVRGHHAPELCMIDSGASRPSPSRPARIRSMYDAISGHT